ncbi:MAG: PepSY domain-containing protein [Methylococcaceae bacterium]|nr:PepSY domain-containing protein [Methylococcaceae bacterium]
MSDHAKDLTVKPTPRRQKWRSFWLNVHLYLGLSVGLLFVLIGLSGSLLVFYVEIDELINPVLQISRVPVTAPKTYEAIFQALRIRHPERTGAWRLEVPRHAQAPLIARYYKPIETEHLVFAPLMASVNPYSAEVTSSRFWGEFLMTWIYDFHYTLLLDSTGKTIMGIGGGFLLLGLGTGLYLWWPAPSKLRMALSIKKAASKPRFIFDLHKLNGVYGFVILALLILSGILLELPDFFNPGIERLSPLYQSKNTISMPQSDKSRITLDQAIAFAVEKFPKATLRWIETPHNEIGSYRIMLYQHGEPSKRFPKTTLWIDQYSGVILSVRNPANHSAGDHFLSWLHPLHSGEIAGLPGRWVVLISGFMPLILYVTGFMRWRQKRRAKRKLAYQ